MKKCNKCKQIKSVDAFRKTFSWDEHRIKKRYYYRGACKNCESKDNKRYYEKNNLKLRSKRKKRWASLSALDKKSLSTGARKRIRNWKRNNKKYKNGEKYSMKLYIYYLNPILAQYKIKKCGRCWSVKNLNKYTKNIGMKGGYDWQCRECKKKMAQLHRDNNKELYSLWRRKPIEQLSDTYIKSILASRSNLKSTDIPQFLVKSKRQQIQLTRTIKRRK